jgi:hypothetical protein
VRRTIGCPELLQKDHRHRDVEFAKSQRQQSRRQAYQRIFHLQDFILPCAVGCGRELLECVDRRADDRQH